MGVGDELVGVSDVSIFVYLLHFVDTISEMYEHH